MRMLLPGDPARLAAAPYGASYTTQAMITRPWPTQNAAYTGFASGIFPADSYAGFDWIATQLFVRYNITQSGRVHDVVL
jgi:hypothetical protein